MPETNGDSAVETKAKRAAPTSPSFHVFRLTEDGTWQWVDDDNGEVGIPTTQGTSMKSKRREAVDIAAATLPSDHRNGKFVALLAEDEVEVLNRRAEVREVAEYA